jgi:hypothetical protein
MFLWPGPPSDRHGDFDRFREFSFLFERKTYKDRVNEKSKCNGAVI